MPEPRNPLWRTIVSVPSLSLAAQRTEVPGGFRDACSGRNGEQSRPDRSTALPDHGTANRNAPEATADSPARTAFLEVRLDIPRTTRMTRTFQLGHVGQAAGSCVDICNVCFWPLRSARRSGRHHDAPRVPSWPSKWPATRSRPACTARSAARNGRLTTDVGSSNRWGNSIGHDETVNGSSWPSRHYAASRGLLEDCRRTTTRRMWYPSRQIRAKFAVGV